MSRLWLTRTRPQRANHWEAELVAAGWQVECLEVLATTPRDFNPQEWEQLRQQAADSKAWLWTSAAAVSAAASDLATLAGRAEQFAVGRSTAAAVASALGQPCAAPHNGHGGAAWVAEYGARLGTGDQLLLLTGDKPRQDWLDPLRALGVQVIVAMVYQREAVPCEIPPKLPDAVVATSGAALQSLTHNLHIPSNRAVLKQPLLLPAARLKTAARRLGWSGTMAVLPALTADGLQAALKDC
jgi:uroporphyrinogen-III synthase